MNAHQALETFTGIVCPLVTNEYGFVSDMVLACPGERDVHIHMDREGRALARASLTREKASIVRVHGVVEPSDDGDVSGHGVVLHVRQFEVLCVAGPEESHNPFPDQEVMEPS
ncbi:hypothetical protein DPQ33_07270 [Oceanidesulfovibrio indonesiensis]|uniref:Uncharacterized protein n=1 Tax=Oceanidesulfovibrio indonesiensis TaxID=54767 RepID=A0A7M3MGA4_9BACT|nr:hypothetical protein [Oceanidesulfovibrio indonesiensis]TVM17902.1 hypothetical protein DPQ33_07270 [Oceanidesulfovibrio indonesiensis]